MNRTEMFTGTGNVDGNRGGENMLTLFSVNLRNLWARMVREEEGQGLAEYAIILVFIALVAIAALTFLGSDISKILSQIASTL